MSGDPEYDDLLAECREAVEFKLRFPERDDVDYAWVLAHAKGEYDRAVEAFRRLDDKAAAVANYVGAGSGLLTLGSVSAAAGGLVNPWVVLCAAPSLLLAAAALLAATHARRPMPRPSPRTDTLVAYADFFGEKGEVAMIGEWHVCTEVVYRVNARKGKSVEDALWLFACAVIALALPLGVALARKFMGLP